MQNIEINLWEISCPDGGGIHSDHVAFIVPSVPKQSVLDLAEDLTKQRKWPHSVREFKRSFVVFRTPQEYMMQNSKKFKKEQEVAEMKEKLAALEKELSAME